MYIYCMEQLVLYWYVHISGGLSLQACLFKNNLYIIFIIAFKVVA